MLGGKNKQPLGYTIVEVMIVLAVSGVMFLIAAQFVNGKQEKASFTNGVGELAQTIQDTIEQVQDGRYSVITLPTCNASVSSHKLTFSGDSTQLQGTNADYAACAFLGKAIQFDESNNNTQYAIMTVAGLTQDSSGNPIASFTGSGGALPTAVDQSAVGSADSLTLDKQDTPQSLIVKSITIKKTDGGGLTGDGSTSNFGVVFLQSLGATVSGTRQSGAQTVLPYYFLLSLNSDAGQAATFINNDFVNNTVTAAGQAQSVTWCVTDGTQYADINLGVGGGTLSVNVDRSVTEATC